jgi:D-glycero-D-manno-heptose 1,7-bisphosphate phosphatase
MNKAVFLDRDGVVINNSEHYYIWKSDQMEFVEGIFDNLRLLQQNGYELFIVSNQGGISRSLYTKEDILKLHQQMISILSNHQIRIRDIAFCPHHPDHEKCMCRKPSSLMIDKLIARYDLSKTKSVMIGDSESDMIAAQLAGIKGIKVTANENMFPQISALLR